MIRYEYMNVTSVFPIKNKSTHICVHFSFKETNLHKIICFYADWRQKIAHHGLIKQNGNKKS